VTCTPVQSILQRIWRADRPSVAVKPCSRGGFSGSESSNPPTPASQCGLSYWISGCARTADIPAGYAGAPEQLSPQPASAFSPIRFLAEAWLLLENSSGRLRVRPLHQGTPLAPRVVAAISHSIERLNAHLGSRLLRDIRQLMAVRADVRHLEAVRRQGDSAPKDRLKAAQVETPKFRKLEHVVGERRPQQLPASTEFIDKISSFADSGDLFVQRQLTSNNLIDHAKRTYHRAPTTNLMASASDHAAANK
jgi:hypothetical protein